MYATVTEASLEALKNLRSTTNFQWYLIPILAFVVWEYSWWNWPNIWLIIVAYCFGFGICVLFFDIKSMKVKGALTVGIYAFDVLCFLLFACLLDWI
jgi:hypothetical protein